MLLIVWFVIVVIAMLKIALLEQKEDKMKEYKQKVVSNSKKDKGE